ncbi:hypothetical protein ACYA63_17180 [Klebsiella pneumoniae]
MNHIRDNADHLYIIKRFTFNSLRQLWMDNTCIHHLSASLNNPFDDYPSVRLPDLLSHSK